MDDSLGGSGVTIEVSGVGFLGLIGVGFLLGIGFCLAIIVVDTLEVWTRSWRDRRKR